MQVDRKDIRTRGEIKRKIVGASAIMMLFTALGTVLGLFREILIGAEFGTSSQLDAFIIAYMVPNMMVAVIVEAIVVSFLPLFTERMEVESEREGWEIANGLIGMTVVVIGALTVLGILFAPSIVALIAPGFKGEERELSVQLTRLMILTTPLYATSGILKAILHSYRHFLAPSLISLVFNLMTITGILLLVPRMGIWGYAISVIVGVFSHILVQLPPLWKKRKFFHLRFRINTESNRKMLKLAFPIVLGMAFAYVNISVDRMFASQTTGGAISSLNYANKVNELVIRVFSFSVASAIFPFFSYYSASKDAKGLNELLSSSTRISGFLLIPASALLGVLSTPVVRVLFERGHFDATSTSYVAPCLFFYSLSLFPFHSNRILNNLFYSLKDTRTPVLIGAAGVVVNVVLDFLLIRLMGFVGLALATTIAYCFTFLLRLGALHHVLEGIDWGRILRSLLKIGIASVSSALFVRGLVSLPVSLLQFPDRGSLNQVLHLAILGLAGLGFYLMVGRVIHIEESGRVLAFLRSRTKRDYVMEPELPE